MQHTARVVIDGGGRVGVGVLRGLARRGWSDRVAALGAIVTAGSSYDPARRRARAG